MKKFFSRIKALYTLPDQIAEFKSISSIGIDEARRLSDAGAQGLAKAEELCMTAQSELAESKALKESVAKLLEREMESARKIEQSQDEIKRYSEEYRDVEQRAIETIRGQAKAHQESISLMMTSAKTIIDGLERERADIVRMRQESSDALSASKALLKRSDENKLQTEQMLAEIADRKNAQLLISDDQKRHAAMALNLCTTSISKIISSADQETMEREYNAILNNLNLQVVVKDEALLTTMRKILDTITFFRLQEGERTRIEERYNQRMNKVIWQSLSRAGGLFVVGGNPFAIATGAAVMAGSMYVGYRNSKAEAETRYADEMWKLQSSAIEQLHALRASLFETAWRLSDAYNFEDAWRLTTKQIEWYNSICAEPDHILRYKKLEQYEDDYAVYPYYWYELAVAAASAHDECPKTDVGQRDDSWAEKARRHFEKFLKLDQDMNLLRQDVVGADARIRYVCLLADPMAGGKGWANAILENQKSLESVKRLAVDDPELLLKAALVYAAGYQELNTKTTELDKREEEIKALCLNRATSYFEKLVFRGNNLPVSSILLSNLYCLAGDRTRYDELAEYAARQLDSSVSLVEWSGEASARQEALTAKLRELFQSKSKRIGDLFSRQFDVCCKIAHPDILNCGIAARQDRMTSFLREILEKNQEGYKEAFHAFWEKICVRINDELRFNECVLGMDQAALRDVAKCVNNLSWIKISESSDDKVLAKTNAKKTSAVLSRYVEFEAWLLAASNLFTNKMTECLYNMADRSTDSGQNSKGLSIEDIKTLLSSHLESLSERYRIVGMNDADSGLASRCDYFDLGEELESVESVRDGAIYNYSDVDAAKLNYFYKNNMSFGVDLRGIDADKRSGLVRIIQSLYPNGDTDYRYMSESANAVVRACEWIVANIKSGVDRLVGEKKYIITIQDNLIFVDYTRPKPDEHLSEVARLSPRAISRELVRLGRTSVVTEYDQQRICQLAFSWLADKAKEIRSETDLEKQQELRSRAIKTLSSMCNTESARKVVRDFMLSESGKAIGFDQKDLKLICES